MKELLLLRHAEAAGRQQGMSDEEKPLSKLGLNQATLMGQHVKTLDITPDIIMHSTALRTTQTAKAIAEQSGFGGEIVALSEFYLAKKEIYEEAMAGLLDSASRVMFVGHNPGIEEFVSFMTDSYASFSPATLAKIDFNVRSWSDADHTYAALDDIWRPSTL